MPRAFSSGAASIWSYALYSPKYLVIAAVSDVLPWSTWPIVPMFTCGFVRSNLLLAIVFFPWQQGFSSFECGAISENGQKTQVPFGQGIPVALEIGSAAESGYIVSAAPGGR